MLKDYYKILKLPTNATLPEIKKAYHVLAKMYHPDKNFNDPFATAQFNDIKEAYDVLINPGRKEVYVQQRWYNQSIGKKRSAETLTPVSVLKLSLELEKFVSLHDVHRMNKEGLSSYISELLSPDTVQQLKNFNEKDINQQIVRSILRAARPLPPKLINSAAQRLKELADNDKKLLEKIENFLLQLKRNFWWKKYEVLLMLLFTLLICLLIFFISR